MLYLYGETLLVNYGPRSILYIYITIYCKHCLLSTSIIYFTTNKHLFPHYTSNTLLSANQWDWQPHCKLEQSSLVVLCAYSMLLLAPKPRARLFLAPLPKSASNNLQEWFIFPTGRLKLGFILRENLLLCSSYLPLGVSQLVLWDITHPSSAQFRPSSSAWSFYGTCSFSLLSPGGCLLLFLP
jgi:hypothetical protein